MLWVVQLATGLTILQSVKIKHTTSMKRLANWYLYSCWSNYIHFVYIYVLFVWQRIIETPWSIDDVFLVWNAKLFEMSHILSERTFQSRLLAPP